MGSDTAGDKQGFGGMGGCWDGTQGLSHMLEQHSPAPQTLEAQEAPPDALGQDQVTEVPDAAPHTPAPAC